MKKIVTLFFIAVVLGYLKTFFTIGFDFVFVGLVIGVLLTILIGGLYITSNGGGIRK